MAAPQSDAAPTPGAGTDDPPGSQAAIVWDERGFVKCAGCRQTIPTPGLTGRGDAGETLCFVCLEHVCKPLGSGLRVLRAIQDALGYWLGGPRKPEPMPEHWNSSYIGP